MKYRSLWTSLVLATAFAVAGCAAEFDGGGSSSTADNGSLVDPNAGNPACIQAVAEPPPQITQDQLGQLLQLVPFYQANFNLLYTGPWTNWYTESNMGVSLIKLAVMRGFLEKYALFDLYLPGTRPGGVTCGPETVGARTANGTCNDTTDPMMGAAGVRFGRNVPPPYGKANPVTMLDPNPRVVSNALLRRDSFKPVPFLNMLAAAWVQFEIHDWFSHGPNQPDQNISVPLPPDDPLRLYGMTELKVPVTTYDASRTPADDAALPPTYQNEVTHWWDGSQLYGSDAATVDRLRSHVGGKLKVDFRGLIPIASDGFDDTGFRRNWWVGLELLHNLFTREHNSIADMLAQHHPDWTDQQLFDHARLITAAEITKIHTLEWTPAIIPNKTLGVAMNANWYGLNKFLVPPFPVRGPDPVVFGIVGNQKDLHGVPYAMTEEFVSVYRMHPMLPESFDVYDARSGHKLLGVPMPRARNAGARVVVEAFGLKNLFYSFGIAHPGALVLQNYPKFLTQLVMPTGVIDMGTVDILRDRERGVPRYNAFRQLIGLQPVPTFAALTPDPTLQKKLSDVYGGDINKMDVMVGMFAESTRPTCYGFGETEFQVFTLMATRRLQADRFYTTSYNADVYTQEGLDWIEGTTMKSALIRQFPELAETGLASVDNAFMPWE